MSGFSYSLSEITQAINGQLVSGNGEATVHSVVTDSRSVHPLQHAAFFALKGKHHDAHNYIHELIAKGCKTFVVSDEKTIDKKEKVNVVVVKNTTEALQLLAAWHRSRFAVPVIGITGSNGKTIVKEWLYQFLKNHLRIVRSPKSYNSQIGVPLSVMALNESAELGIFEAGISMKGEMEKLEKIIQPSIVILTNIGQAHSENFADNNEKIQEKIKLAAHANTIVYCSDHAEIEQALENNQTLKKFSWSQTHDSFVKVTEVVPFTHHCRITFVFNKNTYQTEIPFGDKASLENCMHAITASLALGISAEEVIQKPARLLPVEMRMEQLEGINNCLLINDSYSSDRNSLSIALDAVNRQKNYTRKTVILSDILQDTAPEEKLYHEVLSLLEQKNISRLIGIGKHISKQGEKFNGKKSFFPDTSAFLSSFHPRDFSEEVILIKGARSFEFEKITQILQQKSHETVLEINFDAVARNLNYYRSKLKPGTAVMAMVKAFSYGSGGTEIAQLMEFNRVDYLAVAYADEGVELRKNGITAPVLVMNPEKHSFETIIRYKLEPEIYSFSLLKDFSSALTALRFTGKYPVHIKTDSGMHRLGFMENETEELCRELVKHPNIFVRSVFSHLAASDDPEMDAFTHEQFSAFARMAGQLEKISAEKPLRHILNSGGISRFPEYQCDMVRLGIGLYGIGVTNEDRRELEPASSFKTIISQIRKIKKGDNIGYTGKNKAEKDMLLATLPVGYADGFSRMLGNGKGAVFIRGKLVPVKGNICMDMCMADVTEVEDVREGDEVILFGKELPIEDFATRAGTIPYEVLTSISRRVKRVYIRE